MPMKPEKKKGTLEKALTKLGYTKVFERELTEEENYQYPDDPKRNFVNVRALKNDMSVLGKQENIVIQIKSKGNRKYTAIGYLNKNYKPH